MFPRKTHFDRQFSYITEAFIGYSTAVKNHRPWFQNSSSQHAVKTLVVMVKQIRQHPDEKMKIVNDFYAKRTSSVYCSTKRCTDSASFFFFLRFWISHI